ncbi:MAG TPA: hopanoid-associated sugar epimerase [Syntrophales bacterium]
MKTLITGATGFVGSAVVRQLIKAGHSVRSLVRPRSDLRNLAGLPVETVTGDLTDRPSLDRALVGCSTLFHVAADYRLWVPRPKEIYEANVTGTRNIMLAAAQAGVSRIVYTSSVATLGFTHDGSPADENTPVFLADMVGDYKRSKFLAEAEVKRLAEEEGLPEVIVNPSTPVGPRDIKPTPTGRIIVDAVSGRMPAYVDTGLNLVHVDDVGIGHLLALEHGKIGERYVLGAANLTLKEILTEIAGITGQRPPRVRLPHNLVLPIAYLCEAWARLTGGNEPRVTLVGVRLAKKRMFFSAGKAERVLGFHPRPIKEALVDAVDWFQKNGYIK